MSGKKEQPAAIPPVQDPTDALEEWGTVITSDRNLSKLPRCYGRDPEVARIVKQLTQGYRRSIVLDGDRGVGKTAIVYEVAYELAKLGWHMLEVQPTALLVGTYYLGEWQTRVNKLLESVKQPARIALFVPNFDKLSTIGKSENQDSSAADLFMPLMSTGQLAIVGEGVAGEEGSAWMLRKHAETIEIMPMSQSQTLDIANHLLAGESFSFDDGVTDQIGRAHV